MKALTVPITSSAAEIVLKDSAFNSKHKFLQGHLIRDHAVHISLQGFAALCMLRSKCVFSPDICMLKIEMFVWLSGYKHLIVLIKMFSHWFLAISNSKKLLSENDPELTSKVHRIKVELLKC